MDLRDYKIGARLCLDVFDDLGMLIQREFISQFEEALSEYEAYIAAPIVEGVIYAVRPGWRITVYMQDENTLYRFFARVLERKTADGRAVMKILRISEIDEAQRRRYYRFRCSLPVKYRVLENIDTDLEKEFKKGVTADLSGVGMCLHLNEEVNISSIIECELEIGDMDLVLIGHIVRRLRRSLVDAVPAVFEYEVGILFSDITERDRDLIIKFIFEEQRRQLQYDRHE